MLLLILHQLESLGILLSFIHPFARVFEERYRQYAIGAGCDLVEKIPSFMRQRDLHDHSSCFTAQIPHGSRWHRTHGVVFRLCLPLSLPELLNQVNQRLVPNGSVQALAGIVRKGLLSLSLE